MQTECSHWVLGVLTGAVSQSWYNYEPSQSREALENSNSLESHWERGYKERTITIERIHFDNLEYKNKNKLITKQKDTDIL